MQLPLPPDITNLFPSGFSLHLIRGVPQVISSRVEQSFAGPETVHKAAWLPAPGEPGFEFGFDTTLAFDRFANYPCILIAFRDDRSGGFVPVGLYNCENRSIQRETNPIRLTPLTRTPVPALKSSPWRIFWQSIFPDNAGGALIKTGVGIFFGFLLFCTIPPILLGLFSKSDENNPFSQLLQPQIHQLAIGSFGVLAFYVSIFFLFILWERVSDLRESRKTNKATNQSRCMTDTEAVKFIILLTTLLQQKKILEKLAQGQLHQQAQANQHDGRL